MLQPWPTFRNVLLLLFGVQLSIAAFFLFPSYVEYAHDTKHLGVDLHHIRSAHGTDCLCNTKPIWPFNCAEDEQ